MDRTEQWKVMTSSGMARAEIPIQQKLPKRSDRTYQPNSQSEQKTNEAERVRRCSGTREEFSASQSQRTLHTPIGPTELERPGVCEESEYSSSDSDVYSDTEPPVKKDSNSRSSDSCSDSDCSNDSSSDSSDSSSSDSSSSGSASSNDKLHITASAKTPRHGAAAGLPRNNQTAMNCRVSKEHLRSHVDQRTAPSCKMVSDDAELSFEFMSCSPCDTEDNAEEKRKQATEAKTADIPIAGYHLSSKQVSEQSIPRVSKSIETGAADSTSTDSTMSPRTRPVLGVSSMDEEIVSHIPLPSAEEAGSLEPTVGPHPRNLVRIVMKKSGVTRGISAKKLTKNPVINIFGEIVFDGCTFEGESRPPAAERTADDVLTPSQFGQKGLELNSKEIRNRVCNDFLQKEIRQEIGEMSGQCGGDDNLQNWKRHETEEERGRGERNEEQEEDNRFRGDKVKDDGKSLQAVEKPKESRHDVVCDISENLDVHVAPAEKLTERFPTRLVDYDDDDVGPYQGGSKSKDEHISYPAALRIAQKKDLQPSDGARGDQSNRKCRPERNRSYSRKRRHSPYATSTEERDSVNGSEDPESTSHVKHRAEEARRSADRHSYTTGLKVLKNSDKKFSDSRCSDLQRHTHEKRAQKRDEFNGSESQTTRRNMARSTAKTLKFSGSIKESTDRSINSEVERSRETKATTSTTRSKTSDNENLDTEESDPSDGEELRKREPRRPRDSVQSKIRNKRISSPKRYKSGARTFSLDCYRFRSRLKQGPRASPTRATTPDRNPKSRRRSETPHGEAEVRRRDLRRRSTEDPDDFANGKERLDKTRLQPRDPSDRNATEQILDETRNDVISKSAGISCRSTANRSEQSRNSRSRSSTGRDDASSIRQSSGRNSTASASFRSYPEENCFPVEYGRREKTKHGTETLNPSVGRRGYESEIIRKSGCGKVPSSEGANRTGGGRAGPRSSRGRNDASDPNDNYHQRANYYPNDWMWSPRTPGPYPYLHPFAQPFASPMFRSVYSCVFDRF